jgi:hypothetical protein
LSSTFLPSRVLTLKFLARRLSIDADDDIGLIRCENAKALSADVIMNANSIVFRFAAQFIFIWI